MQTRSVVIHMLKATERMPTVHALGQALNRPMEIFFAFDGKAWSEDSTLAKRHPWENKQVSLGVIGCAHSHLHLLRTSLIYQEGGIAIFEDDCRFKVPSHVIQSYCAEVDRATKGNWDILLFGANEYVESEPYPDTSGALIRVSRFWGTHAMIIRPKAAVAALDAFANGQKEGLFLPADWIYNRAIKDHKLVCIGPKYPTVLCEQVPEYTSLITGRPRVNPPAQDSSDRSAESAQPSSLPAESNTS